MRKLRLCALGIFSAISALSAAEPADPLGRSTPQDSIVHFLEACHAHDYRKAAKYLDLRSLSPAHRVLESTELAAQLEDLLDDTAFDIATLSRDPQAVDDHLHTFVVDGQSLEFRMVRVELRPGLPVWLVSAPSVALIPRAHKLVGESPFEKFLPAPLVTFELFDTPVWRWLALVVLAFPIWYLARAVSWAVTALHPAFNGLRFRAPLRLCLAAAGFRFALELAPPASLSRLVVERVLAVIFCFALAMATSGLVDFIGERWRKRLDPRVQAVSFSVLPLGRQLLKLSAYLIAALALLSAWGYNTSTILAGLGVGGLAVALAAQKTIENLFGGISVIGDRPVLVGDLCRFGDRTGTVVHIGLRSTRLRTLERTVVSIPNGQFAAMMLENISARDRFWFHPTLNLRHDTTPAQLALVIDSVRKLLAGHPKTTPGKNPARLIGFADSSLRIEIDATILTADFDEFIAIQHELLVQILAAVEEAGTALAVPQQETYERQPAAPATAVSSLNL